MRVVHRFGFRPTSSQREQLASLGITLPRGTTIPDSNPLVAFDLEEDHPNWDRIHHTLQGWGVAETHVTTKFSDQEIVSARWVSLVPDWHHGYPQPDERNFGYLRATYDLRDWCRTCGIGLRQKAPFQLKGEPKWGRRSITQLNWVFDEYFVTSAVWSAVFARFDIGSRPVTSARGTQLETVVQLDVREEVEVETTDLEPQTCDACGRIKYRPVVRGYFPRLTTVPVKAIVKSSQYFGSGSEAHRAVLVSHDLVDVLRAEDVRGVSFWPLQPDADSSSRG